MSEDQGATASALEQMKTMQKLMETQMQMMQLQLQQNNVGNQQTTGMAVPASVKNVTVPEGRYDMNSNDYRTFSKDCRDYKKLTNYSNPHKTINFLF